MTVIGHFGAIDDEIIRIIIFWGNRAVYAVEASEVAEAIEVNVVEEVSKAWKIITEYFSHTGSWIQ